MAFLSRPAANVLPVSKTVMIESNLVEDIMPSGEASLNEASLEETGPAAGSAPGASPLGAALAAVPQGGEAVLFEDIVERYHGKVFQLVYRYIGDYDEASDLTQDTFVRAYSAWRDFRGESQVYTWLYRIAINLCHNQQKKLQRRRRVERASLDSAPDDCENSSGTLWNSREVADERPLPLQTLESNELRVRLHEALQNLPENYRTVIILRDIEGLTYEEIARITDSTLEAIKSRLFRARGAIRRLLDPYLNGPLPTTAVAPESAAGKTAARRSTAATPSNTVNSPAGEDTAAARGLRGNTMSGSKAANYA